MGGRKSVDENTLVCLEGFCFKLPSLFKTIYLLCSDGKLFIYYPVFIRSEVSEALYTKIC